MDDLLPHYERELAFLRRHAGDFAERFPKIAGRLMLSGDVGEDPHVERLIESFALLAARVHKRLDDDFPLFTETFLDVLYPHYLRPFPSCAIARFDVSGTALSQGHELARGTELSSRPVRGVACRFRTAYELVLMPVHVVDAGFRAALVAPEGTPLPRGATSMLSIELALTSPQASWAGLGSTAIRLFIDGEASQVAALREALFGRVLGVLVQVAPAGPWRAATADALPREVGFEDAHALLDADARSHPAYRLLTEYFAFADKFNFVDLPLPREVLDGSARRVTLHYALGGLRADSDEARLLETVSARNLLSGCTPVVNLFRQRADPIRVSHLVAAYPVLPDGRRAFGFEVHSIERVFRVQQTPQGEQVHEFKPFFSLQHEQLLNEGEAAGRYWQAQRNETVALASPGYETELSIVDIDFDPAAPQTDTLSIDVSATNRDLPVQLQAGAAGGDLFLQGGSVAREIRLLRRPTASLRFERGRGALWRLISHLSLNHLSLSGGGLDALKELLRLYDLPRSAVNRRVLDALVAIEHRPATACLPGEPFPAFVRGVEVRLTVDEAHFAGIGLRLFAQVLSHFYGLYVHLNSFTQLTILSARSGEELIACPRRSGSSPLL